MTTPDPDAIGPHRPGDRRGWLVFDWLGANWQNAEDSTLECDHRERHWRASVVRERPATPSERALLESLGYQLPPQLTTRVEWLSAGVRNRRWPQLEDML